MTQLASCEICTILPAVDEAFIFAQTEHWQVNLADRDQTVLGRSYIGLKRHAAELDELTEVEEYEFRDLRNGLVAAIRASFSPVNFNVACLKNDAFKADPDNTPPEAAHIHWHILPRYDSNPTEVNGEIFTDPMPGRYLMISPATARRPSRDTAVQIAHTIRSNWPVVVQ